MVPVTRMRSPGRSPKSGTTRSVKATPAVLSTRPSSSPLPITLVSPVTIGAPASREVARIEAWIRSQLGDGEAVLEDHRAGEGQHLGGAHHRQVVHRPGDGQPADVAAGEEERVDHVGVGGDHEPAVADPERRAVVHRAEPDADPRGLLGALDEDLLDERPHRPSAGAVLEADALVPRGSGGSHGRASPALRRSGWPPYWCQILQVPSLRHHAGAHRRRRAGTPCRTAGSRWATASRP